jgi:signal transduction histidine kinase
MSGIGLLLALLIMIQVGWLQKVRAMERRDADSRILKALDKTAKTLESNIYCFEGYTKTFVNAGQRLYIVRQQTDSQRHVINTDTLTIVYNYNLTGTLPDSLIIKDNQAWFDFPVMAELQFNFHIPYNNTQQQSLQKVAVLDTVKPRSYRDVIRNKLGLASLINEGGVDSLLRHNLEEQHIDLAGFGYGFTGIDNTTEFTKRVSDTALLLSSPYAVTLFKENQFLRPVKLGLVPVGPPVGWSFTWWLLLSVLIILLLSIAFLLFVRRYLKQRRLSQMKTDFINNLTHEFNTPMSNIALAVETINGSVSGDVRLNRLFNIISSESYRLRENIERTLQVATIEQGSLQLKKEQVDMVALINTILSGYQSQCEQLEGSITFQHTGNACISGDEVHLLNCLCNLLDNAIRYRSGRPDIAVVLTANANDVILQVTDKGIGMNAETQRHIFEKFYRAHQGDQHNTKGFGLGLNYVKGIIELHGGRINVRSRLGEGSTFIIHLPNSVYAVA